MQHHNFEIQREIMRTKPYRWTHAERPEVREKVNARDQKIQIEIIIRENRNVCKSYSIFESDKWFQPSAILNIFAAHLISLRKWYLDFSLAHCFIWENELWLRRIYIKRVSVSIYLSIYLFVCLCANSIEMYQKSLESSHSIIPICSMLNTKSFFIFSSIS